MLLVVVSVWLGVHMYCLCVSCENIWGGLCVFGDVCVVLRFMW